MTLVASAAVVAMLALPTASLAQTATEARGIERVCPPPEDVVGDDVPELPDAGETHGEAIVCAAQYGVIAGFDDGTFRPGLPVTRGQVASLLARWLQTATGITLPVPDEAAFTDTEGTTHADAIHALAEIGIVGGREDGTFGPGDPLTRGQLAQTVVRSISVADVLQIGGPLPPVDDGVDFTDVDDDTLFADAIRSLAGIGVVQGDTAGAYNPGETVTRGQLATFLMRAADYLDRYQRWKPTAESHVVLVRLRADQVVDDAGDDEDDPEDEGADQEASDASAVAVLTINAFNGTMGYTLELDGLDGPFGEADGATLHLGVAGETGPMVLHIAEGSELDEATDGVVTGVVLESDSDVRFADLVALPDEAYLQIATEEHPQGAVRGQLDVISTAEARD